MKSPNPYIPLALLSLGLTPAAFADEVLNDNLIVQQSACVGLDCIDGEVFGGIEFKIKDKSPQISLEDTVAPGTTWSISGAGADGTGDALAVVNETTGNPVLTIEQAAPASAMYMTETGRLGVGTMLPAAELHVVSTGSTAKLRLEENTGTTGFWNISSSNNFLHIGSQDSAAIFWIESNAPTRSLYIEDNGYVGVGTDAPSAPLELGSDEAFNFFRISADGAAVNESVDITFTGGPLGTGQLRYNIVDGDNQEMSLDADGNMVLDGTLTTAGPTCAAGCDRVFEDGYALPSITDHAAQMYAAGHLPSIGATVPHAPVNVTEKLGHTINALEHAHIYIDQLHGRLAQQEDAMTQQAALNASLLSRLEALEAQ